MTIATALLLGFLLGFALTVTVVVIGFLRINKDQS